jgi:hypothetical protein
LGAYPPNNISLNEILRFTQFALWSNSRSYFTNATMPKIFHQNPDLMTVLQSPCSPAFIFEIVSDEARVARDILALDQK